MRAVYFQSLVIEFVGFRQPHACLPLACHLTTFCDGFYHPAKKSITYCFLGNIPAVVLGLQVLEGGVGQYL
jgi:hypothetical protein